MAAEERIERRGGWRPGGGGKPTSLAHATPIQVRLYPDQVEYLRAMSEKAEVGDGVRTVVDRAMRDWPVERSDPAHRRSSLPTISFRRDGLVGLNAAAFRALGSPEYVAVSVDDAAGKFLLTPVAEGGKRGVYRVRQAKGKRTWHIWCQGLMRRYGLVPQMTRYFAVGPDGMSVPLEGLMRVEKR